MRALAQTECDDGAAFRAISRASGFAFLGACAPRIRARRRPGFEVYAADGRHLNDNGHAALGEMLAADFAKRRASQAIGIARSD